MKEIKITFDPPQYNGWTLEYLRQHDGNSFKGRKGADTVYAVSIEELMGKIDEASCSTLYYDPPIRCAVQDKWTTNSPWRLADIFAVRKGTFFYRYVGDEEERMDFISNIEAGHRKIRLFTEDYNEIAANINTLLGQNSKIVAKIEREKKRYQHVTAAKLLSHPTKTTP